MSYPVFYPVENTTLYIPFATYAGSTGASITLTGLAVTDIEIYKAGSTTQRASDAGYALLDTDGIDFDGVTGIHGFSIDLSDNTTAGFYAVGSQYFVVVSSVTVDSQTVNFIAAWFEIVSATRRLAGTALPAAAADAAGGLIISDAGGLDADAQLVTKINDILTDTGTTLQGELDGIQADTEDIQSRLPAALVSGRIDASVGAMAANVMTAAAAAADLTTELQSGLATAAELAKVPKSDGTATWNATALASINAEADTALADYDAPTKAELDAAVANVSVDEIQATALADLFNTDSGTTYASAVAGSVVAEIADNAGGSALTEAGIADAVWDEATAGHVGAGSFGKLAADTKTDTAAILVDTGTTLDGKIDTIDTNVDSVLADTNELQTDWADGGRLDLILDARASQASVDTLDDFMDTEIAAILAAVDTEVVAIKAKTDGLTFTVANVLDANIQRVNDVALVGDGSATPWGP